jgi:hypothetical protein
MINKGASFVGLGDALYDMKLKLNATANQLTDWNHNQVKPCTWNSLLLRFHRRRVAHPPQDKVHNVSCFSETCWLCSYENKI